MFWISCELRSYIFLWSSGVALMCIRVISIILTALRSWIVSTSLTRSYAFRSPISRYPFTPSPSPSYTQPQRPLPFYGFFLSSKNVYVVQNRLFVICIRFWNCVFFSFPSKTVLHHLICVLKKRRLYVYSPTSTSSLQWDSCNVVLDFFVSKCSSNIQVRS